MAIHRGEAMKRSYANTDVSGDCVASMLRITVCDMAIDEFIKLPVERGRARHSKVLAIKYKGAHAVRVSNTYPGYEAVYLDKTKGIKPPVMVAKEW